MQLGKAAELLYLWTLRWEGKRRNTEDLLLHFLFVALAPAFYTECSVRVGQGLTH